MKKILIVNSHFDEAQQKSLATGLVQIVTTNLQKAIRAGQVSIWAIEKNFRESYPTEIIPRNFDLYLVHPPDAHIDDLRMLRLEQPNAWLYGSNRTAQEVLSREPELAEVYHKFLFWLGDEEVIELANRLGVEHD